MAKKSLLRSFGRAWKTLSPPMSRSCAAFYSFSNNSAKVGSGKTFDAASFTRDFETNATCPTTSGVGLNSLSTNFCTADDTTYATGSKDTLGIGNGGWQCNHDNNVNSKIDIMNAYAASYTIPAGQDNPGDKVLYFAMEKNKNNGTNDVGFWFLQGDASCSAPSGHKNWTGSPHTVGDVLVVSEFSSGGGVSSIFAYKWVGGSTPLVQIAAASGGARNGNLAASTECSAASTRTASSHIVRRRSGLARAAACLRHPRRPGRPGPEQG